MSSRKPSYVNVCISYTGFSLYIIGNAMRQAIQRRWRSVRSQRRRRKVSTTSTSLSLNRATDWASFQAAAARWKLPTENLIYADVDGNIGWIGNDNPQQRVNDAVARVVRTVESESEADRLLALGKVQFVLSIPEDFSRRLLRGERPTLLLTADATDPAATSNAVGAFRLLADALHVACLADEAAHLRKVAALDADFFEIILTSWPVHISATVIDAPSALCASIGEAGTSPHSPFIASLYGITSGSARSAGV